MRKTKTLKPESLAPKTRKVAAKRTVQQAAAHVAAREGGKAVAKVAAKAGAKVGGKALARGIANPWLIAADGVDFGVRKVCDKCDVDEDTAKAVGKGSGLAASVGIGAAVGGPVGAVAGAALWGIGEGVSKLFGWD